jgi:hypothetical protein
MIKRHKVRINLKKLRAIKEYKSFINVKEI